MVLLNVRKNQKYFEIGDYMIQSKLKKELSKQVQCVGFITDKNAKSVCDYKILTLQSILWVGDHSSCKCYDEAFNESLENFITYLPVLEDRDQITEHGALCIPFVHKMLLTFL